MTRTTLATAAAAALLALTAATWFLAESAAPPWLLAAVALVKLAVIGWVFLELDKVAFVWPLIYMVTCASMLGGVVLLMG
jgi:hypothetical protein